MIATWPGRSAYLRPCVVERWDDERLASWAAHARGAGVTAAVTKLDVITPERRKVLDRFGLSLVGSFSCYSDHRHPAALPGGIRPVGRDGRPLAPVEWYSGLVPGSERFDDALETRLLSEARRGETEWVLLDFLRWPGHWEIESRRGAHPRDASFDAMTLSRFAAALGQRTASVADVDAHELQWHDFRVATIVERAQRFAEAIRQVGARPGMFLVPVDDERRRRDYGQDAQALAEHMDIFCLMTYQQMLELSGTAILELADDVAGASERPVVAMIQTSAAPEHSDGWDWGPAIDTDAVAALATDLDVAAHAGRIAGSCYFPGEALLPPSLDMHTIPRGRS